MPEGKIYVITGASRGIGLELARNFSSNASNTVYAAVRDPAKATDLKDIAIQNENVRILNYDASDKDAGKMLAVEVAKTTSYVDFVIANAGISQWSGKIQDAPYDQIINHFAINTVAPWMLLSGFIELLEKGPTKTFVTISSNAGSMGIVGNFDPFYQGPYSVSKAAVNMFTVEAYNELKARGLKICAIHPGAVDTDMLRNAAEATKELDFDWSTLEILSPGKSTGEIVKVLSNLKTEQCGHLVNYDGNIVPF
ncbi:hypothetical protein V1511DRAFT_505612 [Dipodascopsis uninucleata]